MSSLMMSSVFMFIALCYFRELPFQEILNLSTQVLFCAQPNRALRSQSHLPPPCSPFTDKLTRGQGGRPSGAGEVPRQLPRGHSALLSCLPVCPPVQPTLLPRSKS